MTGSDFQSIMEDFTEWELRARWGAHGTLANFISDFELLAKKVANGSEYDLGRVINLDISPEKDGNVEEDQEIIQLLQASINRITKEFLEQSRDQQLSLSMLKAHLKHIHDRIDEEAGALLSKDRASSLDIPHLKEKYVTKLRSELQDTHTRSMARFFSQQGESAVRVQRRTGYDDTIELIDAKKAETYVVINDLVFPESRPLNEETNRIRYFTNFITAKKERTGIFDGLVDLSDNQVKQLAVLPTEEFGRKIKAYKPARMHGPGRQGTSLDKAKIKEEGEMVFQRIN